MEPNDSSPVIGASRRQPDFMVIGAMKSGSTTLHEYLDRHSRIFMCSPKEPMFFSRQEKYAKGLEWYFSLFQKAGENQICGEASTCYSRWPYFGNVAERIHTALPDTRFIYIMRHPVDRAYSHYCHLMEERQGRETEQTMLFEEAIEQEPEILDTSMYRLQLEKFLEYFPIERFHMLFFEDMTAAPNPSIEGVLNFLGLALEANMLDASLAANPSGSQIAERGMEARVNAVRRAPAVSALVSLIPVQLRARIRSQLIYSPIAAFVMRQQIQGFKRKLLPMRPETRQNLLQHFSTANRDLEELIGRPVPRTWHE